MPATEVSREVMALVTVAGVDAPYVEGAVRYIGFGATEYGYNAACIVDLKETPYVAEPHVTWFPWVNARQRISNFKWAMSELSERKEVLLIVAKEQTGFFDHFTKKGLLRKAGDIINLPKEAGEEIHMYQVNRS